jgi:arylsulfatase
MRNRSWTLSAKVKAEGARTQGVIMGFGGVAAGVALYVKNGVPIFDYNYFEEHTVVRGRQPLANGEATIEVDFVYAGGGAGKGADITLSVDGQKVGEGKMDATVGGRFGIDTFGIGEDTGQPVTPDYKPPFRFTGQIQEVVIEVQPGS